MCVYVHDSTASHTYSKYHMFVLYLYPSKVRSIYIQAGSICGELTWTDEKSISITYLCAFCFPLLHRSCGDIEAAATSRVSFHRTDRWEVAGVLPWENEAARWSADRLHSFSCVHVINLKIEYTAPRYTCGAWSSDHAGSFIYLWRTS